MHSLTKLLHFVLGLAFCNVHVLPLIQRSTCNSLDLSISPSPLSLPPQISSLTNLIVTSQNCMRQYAYEQLLGGWKKDVEVMKLAQISSRSCVSQRDIQRVFTLYQWLISIYKRKQPHGAGRQDYNHRAVLVALGIVYYMRLNAKYRGKYQDVLNNQRGLPGEVNFTKAFEDELDWYIKQVELPKGIARTQALKENLFATIICTVTHTRS